MFNLFTSTSFARAVYCPRTGLETLCKYYTGEVEKVQHKFDKVKYFFALVKK